MPAVLYRNSPISSGLQLMPSGNSKRREMRIAIIFSLGLAATMFLFAMLAQHFTAGHG